MPSDSSLTVHYKIYDDDKKETRKSRYPVTYADDPCIGRVNVATIPGEHTVGALIVAICKREQLRLTFELDEHEWNYGTILFKSADTPLAYRRDGSEKIDLASDQRPGSTPQEPVILKIWFQGKQKPFGMKPGHH